MAADLGPLPGVLYPAGTMAYNDIYATHSGVGGITTQDRALPAFGEATHAAATRAAHLGNVEGITGTAAGWFALLLVAIALLAWRSRP